MQASPGADLAAAVASTASVVDDVSGDQWDRPSPCEGWSARDVLDHLVTGHRFFAAALAGGTQPPAGPAAESQAAESQAASDAGATPEPATTYRQSAQTMLDAFGAPGALERMVTLPVGTVPGSVALQLRVVESLVHGWDIAVATGSSPAADDGVAERALMFTQTMLAGIPQEHRPFAAPVPVADGAPALERLAAYLGRRRP